MGQGPAVESALTNHLGVAVRKIVLTSEFKEIQEPAVNIALTLLEPLPVGILFTLMTAGVLSRKRRAEGAAAAQVEAPLA